MRTLISLLAATSLLSCALMAKVEKPTTKAEYDSIVKKANDEQKNLAIKFSTSWCHFCQEIHGLFHDLDKDASITNFVYIEIDGDIKEFAGLKKEHKVTGYPTTIITDTKNKKDYTIPGASKQGITSKVKAISKGMVAAPAPIAAPKGPAKKAAPAQEQKPAPKKNGKKSKKNAAMMPE